MSVKGVILSASQGSLLTNEHSSAHLNTGSRSRAKIDILTNLRNVLIKLNSFDKLDMIVTN